MAGTKLHGDMRSQPVRSLAMMMSINDIKYEYVFWDLLNREETIWTEAFIKMNPLKRVPTLEIDGNFIIESNAALQYLAEREGVPDHWYPRGGKERILVNTYLAWHGVDMRGKAIGWFFHAVVQHVFRGLPIDEKFVEKGRMEMEGMFDQLETIWLKENRYIAGDDITIADLQCINELNIIECVDYVIRKDRPKLSAWMERVRERLNPHYDDINREPLALMQNVYRK
ncbi:unnamed protein product [Owenia fusiformis]|uniref:Uncharacterized protein n=1 Tax=Owenia fusiformis TaxID=6347 RepID=A0A8J1TTD1_OWEFU|nr:unnamed protein product [Owenia fusiformis]